MAQRQATTTSTDAPARLRAVLGKLSRRLRPTIAGTGLTPTQISVLFSVVRCGPLSLTELAELEGLNPTALSRAIGRLVERGLIRREPLLTDRRAARVEATNVGRRLRERIHRERTDVLALKLVELSATDQRAIIDALPALEALAEGLGGRRA